MSLAGPMPRVSPLSCSGAMKQGVPTTAPLVVTEDSERRLRASPKSIRYGWSSPLRSRMLPGFTSRWTMP